MEFKRITAQMKESLIQLVQDNPPLWDLSHPSYCLQNITDNCWKKVENEMKLQYDASVLIEHKLDSSQQLKGQWQNLRVQYSNYKRISQGKSGDGLHDVEAIKWQFFRQMNFLSRSGINVPTTSSIHIDNQKQASGDRSNNQSTSQNIGKSSWDPSIQRKRKHVEDSNVKERRDDAFIAAVNALCSKENEEADDEDSAFVKYLSTQLKKFSLPLKMECHKKIFRIIEEANQKQLLETFTWE
jgi:hypothetical protein